MLADGSPYARGMAKRTLDIVAAGGMIVLLSPVLIVVAIVVRASMGAPVLFSQARPGLRGHSFLLEKFRTMRDARDASGRELPDAERITRFGRWLRSTSIDELPQLFSVLKGEMSLVGPRPLLVEYLPLYTPEESRRHHVRPGITGWAQVNGRNAVTWGDKLAMDTWYVDNASFALDLRILWRTLGRVFARHGVSAPGHATAHKFKGTAP